MNEEKIDELKDALRLIVNLISKRGKPLSDDMKLALTKAIEHVAERIEQLRNEVPITSPIPQLEPGPYPSSNINSFKYDPDQQKLWVKFHGDDTADSGPTYSYEGVPEFIFNIFAQGSIGPKTSGENQYHRWIQGVTPSLGGTMNALIKAGGFAYQRLS